MATEIERKFLVRDGAWRNGSRAQRIRQGYVLAQPDRSVRVRIAGEQAFLTIKYGTNAQVRLEFEYAIPPADAMELLDRVCERPLVEKTRHTLEFAGREWTVDEFAGENEGLVLAEIELDREGQWFEIPPWAGDEVTGIPRYFNASLIARPFRSWSPAERANRPGA